MMRITEEMVQRAGISEAWQAIFEREWPERMDVTVENLQRARKLRLDMDGLARHLLPPAVWDSYLQTVIDAGRKRYEAITLARRECYRAVGAARRRLQSAKEAAWRDHGTSGGYDEAIGPAVRTYATAAESAREARDEAISTAEREFDDLTLPALVAAFARMETEER